MPIRAYDERLRPDRSLFLRRHGLMVNAGVSLANLCNEPNCRRCYEPDPSLQDGLSQAIRDFLGQWNLRVREDARLRLDELCNDPGCEDCYEPDNMEPDPGLYREGDDPLEVEDEALHDAAPEQHSMGAQSDWDAGTPAWRQRHGIALAPGIADEDYNFTGCFNPLCRSHYIPRPEVRYSETYAFTYATNSTETQRQREEDALRRRDEELDARRREDSRRRRRQHEQSMGRDVRVRVEDGSKPSRLTRPYGVEIEATFDEEPFSAGYSNAPPMPARYYGGWKAKTDSSIRGYGIEAVSPILRGAGSLGEIIHTADMMVEAGGCIDRTCGFHVTLSTYDTIEQMQIMRFFTLLEEAAFAVSASWDRFRGSEFTAPMKGTSYYRYIRDGDYFREKYAAVHNKSDCIEFRYPSGTMEPEQIVLNVGLTQLFVRLAAGLDDTVIQKIMDQGLNIHDLQIDATERVRMFTLYGLMLLHAQGWCEGGSFWGVAYNPNNHPTYTIRDKMREHEHQIVLPDGDKLFNQYRYNTIWWGTHLGIEEDVESIINGDPTSTVLETLEIITGGEPLVLPQAGNMKATMSYA